MEYMLMFIETTDHQALRDNPDTAPGYWGAWTSYIGAMAATGTMTSGNGQQPRELATTVRVKDGKRQVQDGPFADTREHLAGYVILKVDSIDQALEWAARAPCAATGVEVRPVMPPPPGAPV
jgi:hypothetical protein